MTWRIEEGAAVLRLRFGCSLEVSRADAKDVLVASGYPREVERLRELIQTVAAALAADGQTAWAEDILAALDRGDA